ncbi:hypothetical protein NDU88_001637 [Pleurodeles waltl]|uniref:Uncharacterized protein n=1 Tax=Pleurodeles waltl TaxID=8319 RepID=A0AAV7P647_PLEWA|nr:hypothetical protein NDU88_001637 [Pleurodeles waltl]
MRNQSLAKPGQVCFRRFASLCVGGVDAAGLQIGTGSVNQGGPAPGNKGTWPPTLAVDGGWQGRFHAAPPQRGQSTLVSGRPGRRESRRRHPRAPGLPTPAHRLCVPQGGVQKAGPRLLVVCSSAARRHQVPPLEQGANSPAGAPIRNPLLQGGPASESDAGRSTPPSPGSRPQSTGDPAGPGPRRGARVRRGPPPGPRPHLSSPGRTSRSPSALRHGEPPSPARLGPTRRQGRGLSLQSRAAPATREPAPGGESAPPQLCLTIRVRGSEARQLASDPRIG